MSDHKYLGKKFACPGCQSTLKFRRPPTTLLQTCPHCRRKLRLQDRAAAASKDDEIQQAIESLVSWKKPEKKRYDYRLDPDLDRIDSSTPGIWVFDQPWPESAEQVVMERAEVHFNPKDLDGVVKTRQLMMEGKFRRVTIFRTGEVEEIEVTGHWWDYEHHESKVGILPRHTVRELNKITKAKKFAAKINYLQHVVKNEQECLELFIDVAIDESADRSSRGATRFR